MPSATQRLTAIALSAAITVGGAWLASLASTGSVTATSTIERSDLRLAKAKPPRAGLTVQLRDVRAGKGDLIVLVFDDPAAFGAYDADKAAALAAQPASAPSPSFSFPDLTGGPFAVAIVHDENGNGDLDMDGSVPTEGYGLSGARDAYDEPDFSRAAQAGSEIEVRMHYLE